VICFSLIESVSYKLQAKHRISSSRPPRIVCYDMWLIAGDEVPARIFHRCSDILQIPVSTCKSFALFGKIFSRCNLAGSTLWDDELPSAKGQGLGSATERMIPQASERACFPGGRSLFRPIQIFGVVKTQGRFNGMQGAWQYIPLNRLNILGQVSSFSHWVLIL